MATSVDERKPVLISREVNSGLQADKVSGQLPECFELDR
jgi:hypothetical protein